VFDEDNLCVVDSYLVRSHGLSSWFPLPLTWFFFCRCPPISLAHFCKCSPISLVPPVSFPFRGFVGFYTLRKQEVRSV